MTMQQGDVCDERVNGFIENHPEFKEVVTRWAKLLLLQQEVMAGLKLPDVQDFAWTEEEFIGGVPLVTKLSPQMFMEPFRESAAMLGSYLAEMFPPLGESLGSMQKSLKDDVWSAQCLAAVVS